LVTPAGQRPPAWRSSFSSIRNQSGRDASGALIQGANSVETDRKRTVRKAEIPLPAQITFTIIVQSHAGLASPMPLIDYAVEQ
jgi:hypothetical protein